MNGIEGNIVINCNWTPQGAEQISVVSTRSTQISRIFQGQEFDKATSLLPVFFTLCSNAHTSAALVASNNYSTMSEEVSKHYQFAVMLETLKEHLIRILLYWPKLFNLPKVEFPFHKLTQLINSLLEKTFHQGKIANGIKKEFSSIDTSNEIELLKKLIESWLIGQSISSWKEKSDFEKLKNWKTSTRSIIANILKLIENNNWQQQAQTDIEFLPQFNQKQIGSLFSDKQISSIPTWKKRCCETSCLSRYKDNSLISSINNVYGNGLYTRIVAKVVELVDLMSFLEKKESASIISSFSDVGIASVETARGRLIHRVELEGNHIKKFQIIAPTEWNFHPEGAIASGLSNIVAKSKCEFNKLAQIFISALDPCVNHQLRVY